MGLPPFKKPNKQTSDRMRKVLRKGTLLERSTAQILRSEKIRFRSQPKIIGNPDFRILGTRIVVFCDSSFWHGRRHNMRTTETFHKNIEYWHAKLQRNRSRDRRVSRELRKRGWIVLRFWDEVILKRPRRVASRILKAIQMHAES